MPRLSEPPTDEFADRLASVTVGEELVFNEREEPVVVTDVLDDAIEARGTGGSSYTIFKDGTSVSSTAYRERRAGLNPTTSTPLWRLDVVGPDRER